MAGSINPANVVVGYNGSLLKAGVDASRKQLTALRQTMEAIVPAATRYAEEIAILDKYNVKANLSSEQYGAAVDHIAKKHGIETDAAREARLEEERLGAVYEENSRRLKHLYNMMNNPGATSSMKRESTAGLSANSLRLQSMYNMMDNPGATSSIAAHQATLQAAMERRKKAEMAYDIAVHEFNMASEANKQAAMEKRKKAEMAYDIARHEVNKKLQEDEEKKNTKKPTASMLGNFGASASRLGASILSVYTAIALVKRAGMLAIEAEQAEAAFEVLSGSLEKTKTLITDIRTLDAKTALGFSDLAKGAKTMMGYGIGIDIVKTRLEQLAAVSMGNTDRFNSLALAMGQVTAATRLQGTEVLQLVNAGWNPLKTISEQTGKSMSELRDLMAEGGITTKMVTDALDAATSAGGMFHGMNEKMAETLGGKLNKALSQTNVMLIDVAKSGEDSAKRLADAWANNIGKLEKPLSFAIWLTEKFGEGAAALESIKWGTFFSDYEEAERERAAKRADELNRIRQEAVDAPEKERKAKEAAAKEEAAALKKFYDEKMSGIKSVADKENEEFMKRTLSEKGFAQWQLLQKLNLIGLDANQRQQAIAEFNATWKTVEANIDAANKAIKNKEDNDKKEKAAKDEATRQGKIDAAIAKLTESVQNPVDALATELQRLDALIYEGLDPAIAAKEKQRLGEAAADDALKGKKYGAVSAMEGSREAYKLLVESERNKSKDNEKAQKTRELIQQGIEEMNKRPAMVLFKAGG